MKVNEVLISAAERERPSGILALERKTYREVYDLLGPQYGADEEDSPGHLFVDQFFQAVGSRRGTILDAGCGAGHGALTLRNAGFEIAMMCDLFDQRIADAQDLPFREACLWRPLRQQLRIGSVDWVYCCDVLEHIPTQFVGLVIQELLSLANQALFISVAMNPDKYGVLVGTPLHQTVKPYRWWRETCHELGRCLDARDLGRWATFYVEPMR